MHQNIIKIIFQNIALDRGDWWILSRIKVTWSVRFKHQVIKQFARKLSSCLGESTLRNTDFFLVNNRINNMKAVNESALLPHLLAVAKGKYPIEIVFRNVTRVLVDNVSSEICFLQKFFNYPSGTSELKNLFDEIFGATLKIILVSEGNIKCIKSINFEGLHRRWYIDKHWCTRSASMLKNKYSASKHHVKS